MLQHQAQGADVHVMDQFGSDLAGVGSQGIDIEKRKGQRIKRGECPTCRRKTHKVSRFPFGSSKREPLTVEGEVHNGQCLRCTPKEGGNKISYKPAIPDMLEVPSHSSIEADEMTVASEITMDPFLTSPSLTSGSRYTSSHSHSHIMESHFESVSEEAPMTDNIEHRGQRYEVGGDVIDEDDAKTEESEEHEEEVWEGHQHLLRHGGQNFHPPSVHHNSSNSEQSISLSEDRDQQSSVAQEVHNIAQKQQFHPLSKISQFSNSEASISVNDVRSHASEGEQSLGDSERIMRLCQGYRSTLLMETEERAAIGTSSVTEVPSEGTKRPINMSDEQISQHQSKSSIAETNRFALKRLSSPSVCSDDGRGQHSPLGTDMRKCEQSEPNRFSRMGLDLQGRKPGEEKESNRFSLTLSDLPGKRRQSSLSEMMPADLQMEMNASRNWDSMDILRDAAAEANGDDLDAAVDALFGIADRKQDESSTLLRTPANRRSSKEEPDDLDIESVAKVLSRRSTAFEEAEMATAIEQRRNFKSADGIAIQFSTIKDIEAIIHTVNSRPNDEKCTEKAFQALFLLATDPDPEGSLARKETLAKGGLDTLTTALWNHMQQGHVVLSLFHALWAVSVLNEKDKMISKICMRKIQECDVLEGLLFAMQSHAKDMSIQESGCDLITRLSGLLPGDTPELKSAVAFLSSNIKNINKETKSYSSCLDALNSLCQLSDPNKREFAEAGDYCHNAVIDGLIDDSMETRELAANLFWCVTSDRKVVSLISSGSLLTEKIMDSLKTIPRAKSSVHFFGAACGVLGNLAQEPGNHREMVGLGVVPILCEAIYIYDFSVDVRSTACTALANLSASRDVRNSVSQGSIPALFSAMKSTSDNAEVPSEALRALHNLCDASTASKHAIVADLEILVATFFCHQSVKRIQQITCSILCRLSAEAKCSNSLAMSPKTLDALARIMKSNRRKRIVQKAACTTLRNLSTEKSAIPALLNNRFERLVLDAMNSFSDSEELQEDACTFLMNMGSNCPEASVEICSREGINSIVAAMQTMPTSPSLQQATCGALCAITKGDAHKSRAVSAGAVDAVVCLILVHSNAINVLENAVDVLANLSSSKKCTKTIADAGGIPTVIEALRSNKSASNLIVSGSRFIRHMALSDREYANESLGGITPILGCMDEHPDYVKLVEESCKALRCLVLMSESCKDLVISADGVSIIEKTKNNCPSKRWQALLLDELSQ
ncbi:hypothetical protein ACHAWF_006440 [Thalassiosira exigua]